MDNKVKTFCRALHAGFLESAKRYPNKAALDFGGEACTYNDLRSLALRVANTIDSRRDTIGASHWIGVLAAKTKEGYAAILGALCSGKGYVPLSCDAPASRLVDMIDRSATRMLLVDGDGMKLLRALLTDVASPLTVCLVGQRDSLEDEVRAFAEDFKQHAFVSVSSAAKDEGSLNLMVQRDLAAYLLFTSGSTGRPKGVLVSHGNVRHFLDHVIRQYGFTSNERFSQNFEFTFDLSVFDIFVSWEVGACLCPPSAGDKILPKRYINRGKLTVWFSVPSVVSAMQAARQLSPGIFEGLRYSLFCGEALTVKAARMWQEAAPSSTLVNLYGPTEATICCTAYVWDPMDKDPQDECFVPIGRPFTGLHFQVLDEKQRPVADGQIGELWIGGPQVALGYLDNPSETQLRFRYDKDAGATFYRTGDRVVFDPSSEQLLFIGRVDHQVKIRGYRIELGEVEQALRAASGGESIIAVPWPPEGPHDKLLAVLDASAERKIDSAKLLSDVRRHLPDYMVPSEVVCMEKLPLNGNGKIDRRATLGKLAETWS